jgi:hypothetical protein
MDPRICLHRLELSGRIERIVPEKHFEFLVLGLINVKCSEVERLKKWQILGRLGVGTTISKGSSPLNFSRGFGRCPRV